MPDTFPIRTITKNDKEYPELLKEIPDPPEKLYIRGELKEEVCFAIVGSRDCSNYGKKIALKISTDLSLSGITIVSGLALGIDTYSHKAVTEKNKRTIAVLGTGLDKKSIYPRKNIILAKKILETGGCLISELPPQAKGSKTTFPRRNRIISGISKGVLVVEAKERSGSLITANNAFNQKRKVFAVPGSIHSPNSKGVHQIIKRGAKLIESSKDILKELKK